jgi:hypothetical protein
MFCSRRACEVFLHASSPRRLGVGTITVPIVRLTITVWIVGIVHYTNSNATPSVGIRSTTVIGSVVLAVRVLGTVAVVRVARIRGVVLAVRVLGTVPAIRVARTPGWLVWSASTNILPCVNVPSAIRSLGRSNGESR